MSAGVYNPTADLEELLASNPERCIVVEYQRYTQPTEGWVFYVLTPDEHGSEEPFTTGEDMQRYLDDEISWEEYSRHSHRGMVNGWMETPYAESYRHNLETFDFVKVPWDEAPEEFRSYLMSCVLPLEWQSDAEFMKGQTTIHLKGEWPT